MLIVLLALPMLLLGVAVDATKLNGETVTGDLVAWEGTSLTLQVDGTPMSMSTEQLLNLVFSRPDRDAPATASIGVALNCGSFFAATSFQTAGRKFSTVTSTGAKISGTRDQLRAVRFQPAAAGVDSQWDALVKQDHDGDAVIIRKASDELDFLEGKIGDVDAESLDFELDGDAIEVLLTKLEGIVLYRKTDQDNFTATCRVTLSNGDTWNVDEARLNGQELQISSGCGITTNLPVSDISKISFAAGNVVYISDLWPTQVEITPLIAASDSPDSVTQLLYAPRRDESLDGAPLMLRGGDSNVTSFPKGLAVHSRTRLQYRLDGQHRKLRGLAGIDPNVRSAAVVTLQIIGNETLLLDRTIKAGEAAFAIDVPIEGVRRLKLVVDYGDGVDIGDRLNLCNLRTTK